MYPVNEVPDINEFANILGGKLGGLPSIYLGVRLGVSSKIYGMQWWKNVKRSS